MDEKHGTSISESVVQAKLSELDYLLDIFEDVFRTRKIRLQRKIDAVSREESLPP